MSALIKFSILLLPASAIAVYLYLLPGAKKFDPIRSQPREEVCTRDGNRLAQLQARPSLDDAVRFGGELRCLKLWPQLQTLLDSLTNITGSAVVPNLNGATPRRLSSPATQGTSTTSDDICKHDEDRLAELQAKPSIEKAMSFGSKLRCPRLRPQLLAVLDSLGHRGKSAGVSTGAELDASADPAAPGLAKDIGAGTVPPNEPPHASEAAAEAARRVAALESERDALAAEVHRLERHEDSPSPGQTNSTPSRLPIASVERSDYESVAALASLPKGIPARVVIRYLTHNADARERAENLANALAKQGVEVADLRESAAAVRTELSFSYTPDEAVAQQVGRLAGIAPVRRAQSGDGLMVRPGTVELSLSDGNHLAATLASKRESNHE
jgi:hypothetical protein